MIFSVIENVQTNSPADRDAELAGKAGWKRLLGSRQERGSDRNILGHDHPTYASLQ